MSFGSVARFSVFGGVLEAPLDFPELHPAPAGAVATWAIRVVDGGAPPTALPISAREQLPADASVQFRRGEDGCSRLEYSDTGTFELSASGREITWYRPAEVREDYARTDILGRVLALAAQRTGLLMLHASAVQAETGAIGFVAPKFFGKSTLACALTDAGAQLLTDDALAVRVHPNAACAPGVPALRLRSESAAHLRGMDVGAVRDDGEWRHLERRNPGEISQDWAPLSALYVLAPCTPSELEQAAERTKLSATDGALSMVRFAKLGSLLCGMLAVDYLGRAAEIAATVPVYTLRYARDLDYLDAVASQVLSWHRA